MAVYAECMNTVADGYAAHVNLSAHSIIVAQYYTNITLWTRAK